MNEGLEALHHPRIELANIDISAEGKHDIAYMPFYKTKQYTIIEKELKDYQEIKEIAKHFNWDDFTSEVFSVETDKKYRDLFNSAIVDIQKDYRKARALETIRELFDFDFALRFPNNQPMLMITNKRTKEYWEIPIPREKWDSLKKELL